MILNVSRSQNFQQCRRKQWFWGEERLVQLGMTEPLSIGAAYHKGTAILTAKRDLQGALQESESAYRAEMEKAMLLPEERTLHEENIKMIQRMLTAQARQYQRDTWTVLKPEVDFLVELPGTTHHCWFCHRLLQQAYPAIVPDWKDCTGAYSIEGRTCLQPHFLRGRTDGILSWNSFIWILERKTSGMKQNIFWDQWYLSHQLSGYVYGVRKSTGLPVHGVVLEKMPKPAKNQNPITFDYSPEREPYLRTESDLAEFEKEIISIAGDYERAVTIGKAAFYRNPQACIDYNRRCEYWATCKRGGVPQDGEFRQRSLDYVEESYYKILNLEVPAVNPH